MEVFGNIVNSYHEKCQEMDQAFFLSLQIKSQ